MIMINLSSVYFSYEIIHPFLPIDGVSAVCTSNFVWSIRQTSRIDT